VDIDNLIKEICEDPEVKEAYEQAKQDLKDGKWGYDIKPLPLNFTAADLD